MELDIDIGADAKDWAAISANEKLKPVEAELRRVEEAITEVVSEMEYLRQREQMLRDTNESTNNRVKYFGIGTTWLLIGLWAWQIMYLRSYFRYVPGGGERKWAMTTNGLLGLSILSERGGWGMFGKRRLGVESQDFGANDIDGRLWQGFCSGCRLRTVNTTVILGSGVRRRFCLALVVPGTGQFDV